jgi:hypothetical protein
MEDNYYIDLKTIPLTAYAKELEHADLLPSRRILQEAIRPRFACLSKHGLQNLDDLLLALKTPDKLKAFARKTGLPEEYLVILKREVGSRRPKPVPLADFPGIAPETVKKLAGLGLRDTHQLFGCVRTAKDRQALSKKTGLPAPKILELTKLTDVSRIRWVGANFARLLVDSGEDTVEKVAQADYAALYKTLMQINAEKKYFQGKFGLHDMQICVQDAKQVPSVIEY